MLLLLNNEQVFRNTGMMNMSSAMTMTKSDNAQVGDTIVQHSFNITTVSVTSTDTALQKDLGRRELCHYNDTWTDKRTLLHSNNVNIQRTLRGAGCNPAAFTLLSSTDGGDGPLRLAQPTTVQLRCSRVKITYTGTVCTITVHVQNE